MKIVSNVLDKVTCIKSKYARHAIICDETLYSLHGETLLTKYLSVLEDARWRTVVSGDACKTRVQKELIEDWLFEEQIGKDGCLIACGGGATLDLIGFCAATYLRGIDYYTIPTTLLAMVDASIGGKTGINTNFGKNQIGVIYHSSGVIRDVRFLKTLPESELRSGYAEIIKYAATWDKDLFAMIRDKVTYIDEELIELSVSIKEKIVYNDPLDRGLRRTLNFGHTVGHAIEHMSCHRISHGDAVAIGMWVEAQLAHQVCGLSQNVVRFMQRLLLQLGYPLKQLCEFDKKNLYEVMRRDKKSVLNTPQVVMLKQLGEVHKFNEKYVLPVSAEDFFCAYGECLNEMEN